MSAIELYPMIDALPRNQKFLVLQYIVSDLAKEEGLESIGFPKVAEIWTPYDAYEASATVARSIEQDAVE